MKNKDKIIVDGEEYFKEEFFKTLDKVFFDNFHIVLHKREIEIKGKKCLMCGETLDISKLTKHHAIPKRLKSLYNVYIPFCEKCHVKFNNYVHGLKTKKQEN